MMHLKKYWKDKPIGQSGRITGDFSFVSPSAFQYLPRFLHRMCISFVIKEGRMACYLASSLQKQTLE